MFSLFNISLSYNNNNKIRKSARFRVGLNSFLIIILVFSFTIRSKTVSNSDKVAGLNNGMVKTFLSCTYFMGFKSELLEEHFAGKFKIHSLLKGKYTFINIQ